MPVLAKTQSAKEELTALGVNDITVSWVGLDQSALHTDFCQADRAKLRLEYGFSPDDVILCNVSRMEPEKRPLDLIDIFSHIQGKKNFKLLLIGEGPLYEEVSEKIERLGLSEKVKFFRRIPYTDMWKIYTMSDYYLNLSRIEIFGMAIMEAIYYKTSVAANIASGPSVILKDMKGHTLCHNDREFEEWLCAEYPDQSLLEESSRKIQEEFNWGKTAEAFLSKILMPS
jgi:1,2-diacylglycerol 3-alpha-glucosyltransferase